MILGLPFLAEPASQSDVPWWVVPLVGGSFAILGVALSYLFSVRIERRNREREEDWRVDPFLREAARNYLFAMRNYAIYIRSDMKRDSSTVQIQKLNELSHKIFECAADLQFFAPREFIEVTKRFKLSQFRFTAARSEAPVSEREAHLAGVKSHHLDDVQGILADFRDAVREHFGLSALEGFEYFDLDI